MFSEKEIAYIKQHRLTRIATVADDGQPDVAAVRFKFDGEYFYIGGRSFLTTLKYRNVRAGNAQVALVLNDINETSITPEHSWSWGIERAAFEDGKPVFHRNVRKESQE